MKEFPKDAPSINLLLIYLNVARYFRLIYSCLNGKIMKHKTFRSFQSIHKESSICKAARKKVIIKLAKRVCKIIDKNQLKVNLI